MRSRRSTCGFSSYIRFAPTLYQCTSEGNNPSHNQPISPPDFLPLVSLFGLAGHLGLADYRPPTGPKPRLTPVLTPLQLLQLHSQQLLSHLSSLLSDYIVCKPLPPIQQRDIRMEGHIYTVEYTHGNDILIEEIYTMEEQIYRGNIHTDGTDIQRDIHMGHTH